MLVARKERRISKQSLLNSMYAVLPPDFMSMQENWCRRSMLVQ